MAFRNGMFRAKGCIKNNNKLRFMKIEVKFVLDTKDIKKALAYFDKDIPTDKEITEKMSGVEVNLLEYEQDEDIRNAQMAMTLLAVGKAFS